MDITFVNVTVAVFTVFLIAVLWLVWRHFRKYFLFIMFTSIAIASAFIPSLYAPFVAFEPSGLVTITGNYTTVIDNTTTTFVNVTTVKTLYTQNIEVVRSMQYISLMIALISALLGFAFLVITLVTDLSKKRF